MSKIRQNIYSSRQVHSNNKNEIYCHNTIFFYGGINYYGGPKHNSLCFKVGLKIVFFRGAQMSTSFQEIMLSRRMPWMRCTLNKRHRFISNLKMSHYNDFKKCIQNIHEVVVFSFLSSKQFITFALSFKFSTTCANVFEIHTL